MSVGNMSVPRVTPPISCPPEIAPPGQRMKQGTLFHPSYNEFFSVHCSIVYMFTWRGAIISHKNDNSIVFDAILIKKRSSVGMFSSMLEVIPKKLASSRCTSLWYVWRYSSGIHNGPCGAFGSYIGKEWFVAIVAALHPFNRFFKPDIGAIPLVLFGFVPVAVAVVEIVVFVIIGSWCDAPSRMMKCFMETTILWRVWIVIPKMPFPKMSSVIPVVRQYVCHGQ